MNTQEAQTFFLYFLDDPSLEALFGGNKIKCYISARTCFPNLVETISDIHGFLIAEPPVKYAIELQTEFGQIILQNCDSETDENDGQNEILTSQNILIKITETHALFPSSQFFHFITPTTFLLEAV